jgi:hypothetical protein
MPHQVSLQGSNCRDSVVRCSIREGSVELVAKEMGISRIDTHGKYKEDVVKVFGIVVNNVLSQSDTGTCRVDHLEQAMNTRNASLGEDFQLLGLNMHGKRKLKSRL